MREIKNKTFEIGTIYLCTDRKKRQLLKILRSGEDAALDLVKYKMVDPIIPKRPRIDYMKRKKFESMAKWAVDPMESGVSYI